MNIKKIPFDGILADIVFVTITITLNRYSGLISEHIEIIFGTVAVLQSLTIYAVMLNFDFNDPEFEKLPKFINSIMGLIFVLAAGGFLWIFLPAVAMETPTMWTIATINIFVALFGGILGFVLPSEHGDNPKLKTFNKVIGLFIPAIYLSVTEILIYISAHTGNVDPGMAILAISISYLPIRFLMMIKPPNSIFELITATSVFSYFIYSLF